MLFWCFLQSSNTHHQEPNNTSTRITVTKVAMPDDLFLTQKVTFTNWSSWGDLR